MATSLETIESMMKLADFLEGQSLDPRDALPLFGLERGWNPTLEDNHAQITWKERIGMNEWGEWVRPGTLEAPLVHWPE